MIKIGYLFCIRNVIILIFVCLHCVSFEFALCKPSESDYSWNYRYMDCIIVVTFTDFVLVC